MSAEVWESLCMFRCGLSRLHVHIHGKQMARRYFGPLGALAIVLFARLSGARTDVQGPKGRAARYHRRQGMEFQQALRMQLWIRHDGNKRYIPLCHGSFLPPRRPLRPPLI